MHNDDYIAGKITIQHEFRFPEIKEWVKFQEEKKKIQDKYESKPWDMHEQGKGNYKDPYNSEWWDEWQKYKKEITDLILKPKGNFQKFLWEIRPEREEAGMRIWLRGHHNTEKYRKKRS